MKILNFILVIFCPAIILFTRDNPFGGIFALVLQSTVIGWIPASIWAWKIIQKEKEEEQQNKKYSNNKDDNKTTNNKNIKKS